MANHKHHWEADGEKLYFCKECGSYAMKRTFFRVVMKGREADKDVQ